MYVCVGQAGEAQRSSQSISEELKELKRRHDALHIRLVESEDHERREHERREHEETKRVRAERLLEKVCLSFPGFCNYLYFRGFWREGIRKRGDGYL